jgi:hypothetical protein
VLGEAAGTGRLLFVNGYCRSASASICAITSGWLIRIHSDPLQQGRVGLMVHRFVA